MCNAFQVYDEKAKAMNDNNEPQSNPLIKSLLIWLGILLALAAFVSVFDSRSKDTKADGIAYSEFLSKVDEGSVKEVVVAGDIITGKLSNGEKFKVYALNDPQLADRLTKAGVRFSGQPEETPSIWMVLIYNSLPFRHTLEMHYT